MQLQLSNWRGALWGAAGAALANGALNWPDLLLWLKENNALSGWAQAIGAVIAIWSGFAVARETAERAAISAAEDARSTALAVAKGAYDHAEEFFRCAIEKDPNAPDIRVFSRRKFVAAMDRVPLGGVRDPFFVANYIELQGTVDEVFKQCLAFHDKDAKDGNWVGRDWEEKRLDKLMGRLRELWANVSQGRSRPALPSANAPAVPAG